VWGTLPLGGLLGGALGTAAGVRTTLWIAFAGSWLAGWWVFFSPLRGMRDIPAAGPGREEPEKPEELEKPEQLEVDRAPGSGIPGQGGGELPDGAGTPLGY